MKSILIVLGCLVFCALVFGGAVLFAEALVDIIKKEIKNVEDKRRDISTENKGNALLDASQ